MNYKTELLEENFKKILSNKNYSENTISNYVFHIRNFHISFNKRIQDLTLTDLNNYLSTYEYKSVKVKSSLKLFYKYILGKKNIQLDKIERPRGWKKLPKIIEFSYLLNKIKLPI